VEELPREGEVDARVRATRDPCLGSGTETDASVWRRWIVRASCRGRRSRRGKTEDPGGVRVRRAVDTLPPGTRSRSGHAVGPDLPGAAGRRLFAASGPPAVRP